MEVQVIAVWDLDKVLEDRKALLIDLREREMYEKGHIPGAICVQYEKLFIEVKGFSGERPMVLYCQRGNASLLAGKMLAEQGFVTYTILGGYLAYLQLISKKSVDEV